MSETEELTYLCANLVAENKEKAIKAALNYHFCGDRWTNSDLERLDCEFVVDLLKRKEIFYINNVPVLEFGLMNCMVSIDHNTVQCLYEQKITQLYISCGVGQ